MFVLRARPVMVEEIEEVNVVAFESWLRLKMNIFLIVLVFYNATALLTQNRRGRTNLKEGHKVRTNDFTQHETFCKALDSHVRFSAFAS